MKKTLALLLMLAMLCGCVPALADEPETLTILIDEDTLIIDYKENKMTKYIEENCNVNLEFVLLPATDPAQKLQLMINSGEKLPDVICYNLNLSTAFAYAQAGAIVPMEDLYEKYSVKLKAAVEANPELMLLEQVTAADGHMYGMPKYMGSLNNNTKYRYWINYKWLENLNMEMPTTTEEFYEVLKAFKEKDPNGNGEADEIPLMSATNITTKDAWWRAIMNMYLYVPNIPQSVKDGKVFYYAATDEYREGLKFIRKLIDEGLVDPMTFTADKTQFTALINGETNVVGMTMDMIPYGNANTPRIAEFTGLEPFTGVDGVKRTTFAPSLPVVSAMITSSCEDPEAAFRFLDLLYRQDMSIINHWGEEGKHWARAEETDVSPYANMGYEASFREIEPLWGTVQNIMWYQTGPYAREYFIASGRVLPDNPLTTGARAATIQWAYTPCYPAEGEYIPRFIYTEEESDEISLTLTDLSTYIATARTNFMMNAEGMDIYSDECWNAYLAQLDTIGLQEVLPILQEVYDRMYGE